MAQCAQCRAALSGRWQRRCTECGTLLCWKCGRTFETLTERFCTDCGGDLSAPGPQRELESTGTPGLLVAGAVVAVIAVIVIAALILTHRGHDREPTTIIAAPPANTQTSTTTYGYPTTTTAVPAAGPEAVVQRYFDAINNHDYRAAFDIGGRNFDPDYGDFVASFATTSNDTVTIVAVDGDQVHITLDALQSDGTHRYFAGYYVVSDGILVRASIRRL